MYKVKVNNNQEHTIVLDNNHPNTGSIDSSSFELDLLKSKEGLFHVIKNNKSYTVEVVKIDKEEKTVQLKINGTTYTSQIKDKFDELLKNLGFDKLLATKVNEIKAPMPGLVLNIIVNPGDVVKKGDVVIVLEAMKMENNLKSPADGVVKKIAVQKGNAVEKNQILIQFE